MEYLIHILISIGIFTILSVSLNVSMGYAGVPNLGHVAFYAIGAYTSAIMTLHGLPFVVSFVASGAVAAIFGGVLTMLTAKNKGDYVALITFAFAIVLNNILLNWSSLTGGSRGVAGISRPSIFSVEISSNFAYLVFVFVVATFSVYTLKRLMNSRYGKLIEAVRDAEIGVVALGKNSLRIKYESMAIAAFFAGISGSLFAHFLLFIHPSNFFISSIVLLLSIVIVGGLASVKGSVIGAFVIIGITEMVRFMDLPSGIVGPTRMIIYAVILILVLRFRPRGIFGRVDLVD